MALTVQSLASGSSGNSILVKEDDAAVLIDAGIGIRRLVAALREVEMSPADLSAILITHEHSDHIAGAVRMAARYGIPLISNAATLEAVPDSNTVPTRVLDVGEEMTLGSLMIRPFRISHDAVCPVGYTISSPSVSITSATDTGYVTPELRSEAAYADLLILESNHDEDMLIKGPYPWYLKKRVAGERGHLSNDAAGSLLLSLAESGSSASIWLAHLSKTNNTPGIALASAQGLLYTCLGTTLDIAIARRDVPSLKWHQRDHHFQLSLFDPRSISRS